MIRHTVVFTLVHEPASTSESDFLDAARTVLSAIPGVSNFTVSRQVSLKSDLRHQFAMDFVDADAYAAYDSHPDHLAFVANRWVPEVAMFQEYDFVAD